MVRLGRLSRPEVSVQLGLARAVVLPSLPALRPEGAPLALIEALVHGRPLIVSDDPGCREIARGGSERPAGLVVPAGDLLALAEAIGDLLDHDAMVALLADAAQEAAADAHAGRRPGAGPRRLRLGHALISVVVPTRDRAEHLTACLEALRRELRPGDELVVVDSASATPAEQATLRAPRPGASLARNLGWRAATA